MAKRKGKSRRRQKDWARMHREGDHATDQTEGFRRLSQRKVKLQGQSVDEAMFAEIDPDSPHLHAVVAQLYPGGAIVRHATHGDLLCGLAGTFRPAPGSSALAVGDKVELALTPEAVGLIEGGRKELDFNRVDGVILQRGPRETAFSRPMPSSGKRRDEWDSEVFEKVVAANMQQLVVVAAVKQPPLRRRLLDRFLIVAERGEMPMRLVINKTDLGTPDMGLLAEYAELGVQWVLCSAETDAGLDELRDLLRDTGSILAGASGVGKSSLLNALMPGLDLATREIRSRDNRGRHTTSAALLHELPFGGVVVDTPGVRELGIEIDPAELPWYFPEIVERATGCKFRDCTHTHEPKCAVRDAVEAGDIAGHRYDSYLRILESMEG